MKATNRDEGYEKALSASLARVLELLRFAEAKNAALLTFASAWIIGLVNLLSSGKVLPPGFDTACGFALAGFIIAAIIAVVSLLPKLSTSTFTGDPKGQNANLLFFGDVADLTVEGFKVDVRAKHYPSNDGSPSAGYIDDLEGQIAINGKIAKRKYRLFNRGATLALIAVAALSIPTAGALWNAVACWAFSR